MRLGTWGDVEAVEPVARFDAGIGDVAANYAVIAQWGDDPRGMPRVQIPQGLNIQMVVMVMGQEDHVVGGRSFIRMPGAVTRRGPAKAIGLARSNQTGSVRMLSPPVWINSDAWPTMVMDNPSTRSAGTMGDTGIGFGHLVRGAVRYQRRISRIDRSVSGSPARFAKRCPSKWDETGPE